MIFVCYRFVVIFAQLGAVCLRGFCFSVVCLYWTGQRRLLGVPVLPASLSPRGYRVDRGPAGECQTTAASRLEPMPSELLVQKGEVPMWKLPAVLLISLICLPSVHPVSARAGSERFQTGFHRELGAMAARAAVGSTIGLLNGMFLGPGGCAGPASSVRRGRYVSPYEQAYMRESMRIQMEQHTRWIRDQRNQGVMDARRDFGW